MRRFFLYLTLYTLVIISLTTASYHLLVTKPAIHQLSQNLATSITQLTTVQDQVANLTNLVSSLKDLALHKPTSTTQILGTNQDTSPTDTISQINHQIEQALTANLASTDLPPGTAPDPTPPTDNALGFLAPNLSTSSPVPVYPQSNNTGKPLGQLKVGNAYPYLNQTSSWYQIRLNPTTTGWVEKSLVKEVNGS